MAFDPFTFAATVAVNLASYAIQDRAKRQARRQAEFEGGVEVPETGTPQALPILYGRNKTKGIVSGVRLARSYTAPSIADSETAGADVWLTASDDSGRRHIIYDPSDDSYQHADNTLLTSKDQTSRNDFLFVQYAIGQGELNRIRNIDVNGVPIDDEDIGYGQRVHAFARGGTADPLATSNGFLGTNKFVQCAYATGAFRFNAEAPQYSGIPNLDFYVEGRKVRTVTRTGSAGSYTYALSSSRVYSNNMALVLLDYMVGAHGANIPVSDLDLESFYDAAQVCARVLTRNGYQGYEVANVSYLYARSSTPTLTAAQKPTGAGTRGGVTWSATEPAYTHTRPYLWQSHQASGETTWSDPVPVDPFHREGRQWRVPVSTKAVTQPINEDQMSRVHFSGVVKSQMFAEAEELAFDLSLRRRDTGAVQTFTIVFRESDVQGPDSDPNLPWSWFENTANVVSAPTEVDLGAEQDYEHRYVMRQTRSTGGVTFSASDSTYFPPNAEDMTPVRVWRYKSSAGENESLMQGEFNGALSPDDPVWDNVLKIVSVMQRAKLIWSYGGWTLKIPYPRSQAEQDALKTHHVVDGESEPGSGMTRIDIMTAEPFVVNPPSFETRLNVANGGFKNENSDYDSDSLQWPRYAPTSETSSPYRTYLSEDNNRVLSGSLRLDGITDPFHMRIAVEQQVRSSRSESVYSFAASMDALELEIGDIVPVTAFGYDEDIEIDSLEPIDWSYVRVTGHSFRYEDLAINVADDFAASRPPYSNFAVAPPSLAADDFDSTNRVIPLTITPAEATASAEFLIEQYIGAIDEDTDPDSLDWTDTARTRAVMHEVLVASGERVYNFRARTVSPGGRISAGSNVVTVGVASFEGIGATDGIGVEQAYALFPATVVDMDGVLTVPTAQQPDNSWPYDILRQDDAVAGSGPITLDGIVWTDGPQAPTEAAPIRVQATRHVPGQPAHGAAKEADWSDWATDVDAIRPTDGRYPAIEVDIYLLVDAPTSGGAAPATPTADKYVYDGNTLENLTENWVRARPLAIPDGQLLYCCTASVEDDGTGEDTSVTFSAPVVCNEVIDIDIVYTRSDTDPARPANTAHDTIAAGWYARPGLIPAETTGPLYESVRYLRADGDNLYWTYDDPYRAEGIDGADGVPGTSGRSGYTHRIAVSSGSWTPASDEMSPTAWDEYTGVTLSGITAANREDLKLVQVGSAVTIFETPRDWADYVVSGITTSEPGASTHTATFTFTHQESFGSPDTSEDIQFHFSPMAVSGESATFERRIYRNAATEPSTPTGGTYTKSTRALVPPTDWSLQPSSPADGEITYFSAVLLDPAGSMADEIALTGWSAPAPAGGTGPPGEPGVRGLAGYAESLVRSMRDSSANNVSAANEWYLDGSTVNWSGNRVLTIGVTADDEANLALVGVGALLTVYEDEDNWGDYLLRSAVTFTGMGAARAASISLASVEGVGMPPTTGAIELHFTPKGADGLDGEPGIRGLAGYAASLTRTSRTATAGAADAATEWFLSDGTADWTGNRTLTVGGVTETQEAQLKLVTVGALLTVYDDADNWADYTLRSVATFTGTGNTRVASLSFAHLESVGAPPSTGAMELHFTPMGADGQDGTPALPGFGATWRMSSRVSARSALDTQQEWYIGRGTSGNTAVSTMEHLRTATRIAFSDFQTRSGTSVEDRRLFLNNLLEPGIDFVTLFWGHDRWAELTLDSRQTVTDEYIEFGVSFLEGLWPDNTLPAGQMTIIFSRYNYPLRIFDVVMYSATDSGSPGDVTVDVATRAVTGAAMGWTADSSGLGDEVFAVEATVRTRLETGTVTISASQWRSRHQSRFPGGDDAPFWVDNPIEVPIRAIGASIEGATTFAPNPATASLSIVAGGVTRSVVVSATIGTGGAVTAVLTGDDADDFEII